MARLSGTCSPSANPFAAATDQLHAGAGHGPELRLFVILAPAHAQCLTGARGAEDAEFEGAGDYGFFPAQNLDKPDVSSMGRAG